MLALPEIQQLKRLYFDHLQPNGNKVFGFHSQPFQNHQPYLFLQQDSAKQFPEISPE